MDYEARCVKCHSTHLIKEGKAFSKLKKTWRQRYKCVDCKTKFIDGLKHIVEPVEAPFVYQPKVIPSQNWSAYTQAQNQHKQGLMDILYEMLDFIEIKSTTIAGRPPANLKEICFALALKTFTQLSSRRLHSELQIVKKIGYLENVPHFTILMKYLGSKEMYFLLKELIKISSLPIKQMSSGTFSVDSTGFSTSQFGRWFDYKYDKEKTRREWLKCHAMIENTSNTVVNANITPGHHADSPQFEKLTVESSKNFEISEVSADKAYSSRHNLEIVAKLGGLAYIPFKSNAKGIKGGSMIWRKTYDFFKNQPQEFYEHYRRRSNAETSFSMIKQKFGANLKSKTFIA